jgi:hypothetical protein
VPRVFRLTKTGFESYYYFLSGGKFLLRNVGMGFSFILMGFFFLFVKHLLCHVQKSIWLQETFLEKEEKFSGWKEKLFHMK